MRSGRLSIPELTTPSLKRRFSYIKNGRVTDYGKEEGAFHLVLLVFARNPQGSIGIATGKDG